MAIPSHHCYIPTGAVIIPLYYDALLPRFQSVGVHVAVSSTSRGENQLCQSSPCHSGPSTIYTTQSGTTKTTVHYTCWLRISDLRSPDFLLLVITAYICHYPERRNCPPAVTSATECAITGGTDESVEGTKPEHIRTSE